MNEWKTVRLGDVCEIARGGSPRPINEYITTDENGINWIKIGDTSSDSKYIERTEQKIKPEGMKKSRYVHSGDFILSNSMSFGRPYILKIDGCIHDGWLVLQNIQNDIDKDYLYFVLSSPSAYHQFERMAVGGVVNNLNSDKVKELIFPLPPLEKQKQIAKILDKCNILIIKHKQMVEKYDALIKSRFIEMFGDPVKNTKGWKTESLQQVAPAKPAKNNLNDKVWLLNLDMVESQTGKVIDYLYVNISDTGNSTYQFDEGNVLYSKLRPYLNKVVIPEQSGICTSELVPLRPTEKLNRYFLANLLRTDFFVNFINEKVAGAKMPRVLMDTFRAFDCILPPIELQNDFAAFVQQIGKSKFAVQKSLEKAETLYKSLMQEYFG